MPCLDDGSRVKDSPLHWVINPFGGDGKGEVGVGVGGGAGALQGGGRLALITHRCACRGEEG